MNYIPLGLTLVSVLVALIAIDMAARRRKKQ